MRGWQGAGRHLGWLAGAFFINLVVIEEAKPKIKSTCNSPNPW
jgi:hypothetical protein